jgi:hypothetical protein
MLVADFHPTAMWSNDPFGYGSSVSYLFYLADVNHTTIHRVHQEIKGRLFAERVVPFVWKQVFGEHDLRARGTPYLCRQ